MKVALNIYKLHHKIGVFGLVNIFQPYHFLLKYLYKGEKVDCHVCVCVRAVGRSCVCVLGVWILPLFLGISEWNLELFRKCGISLFFIILESWHLENESYVYLYYILLDHTFI
jgi:hypothetical protein